MYRDYDKYRRYMELLEKKSTPKDYGIYLSTRKHKRKRGR